jgi:hypothetical protein
MSEERERFRTYETRPACTVKRFRVVRVEPGETPKERMERVLAAARKKQDGRSGSKK